MKVKTSDLDTVLQTVVKAAGNKSVFPLTCVVTMCEEDGKLLGEILVRKSRRFLDLRTDLPDIITILIIEIYH